MGQIRNEGGLATLHTGLQKIKKAPLLTGQTVRFTEKEGSPGLELILSRSFSLR